jgi:hypothetical protein
LKNESLKFSGGLQDASFGGMDIPDFLLTFLWGFVGFGVYSIQGKTPMKIKAIFEA